MKTINDFEYRKHGNIVLHQYKTIYFFIPKVACSSLKIVCSDLLGIAPPNPAMPHRGAHIRDYPFVKREEIPSRYNDYFKFCFVRNPWDRLVSCYHNKISKDKDLNDRWFEKGVERFFLRYGDAFRGGMSFTKFVEEICRIPDSIANDHFRSQYTFITDPDGDLLVDFIGRFEKLGEDFDYICQRLGLRDVELPHILKSQHDDYRIYYDDVSICRVRERYAGDIELLGYEF